MKSKRKKRTSRNSVKMYLFSSCISFILWCHYLVNTSAYWHINCLTGDLVTLLGLQQSTSSYKEPYPPAQTIYCTIAELLCSAHLCPSTYLEALEISVLNIIWQSTSSLPPPLPLAENSWFKYWPSAYLFPSFPWVQLTNKDGWS